MRAASTPVRLVRQGHKAVDALKRGRRIEWTRDTALWCGQAEKELTDLEVVKVRAVQVLALQPRGCSC